MVPAEYKETSSPRSPLHASGPCIRLWFPTQTECAYSRLLSLPPPGSGSCATRVAVYRLLLLTGIATDTNTTATAATTTPTTNGTSSTTTRTLEFSLRGARLQVVVSRADMSSCAPHSGFWCGQDEEQESSFVVLVRLGGRRGSRGGIGGNHLINRGKPTRCREAEICLGCPTGLNIIRRIE